MKIEVNVTKTRFLLLLFAILGVGGVLVYVQAQAADPLVFHDVDQIDWTVPISDDVNVQGDLLVGSNLNLINNLSVGDNLTVKGEVNFEKDINVEGSVDVSGNIDLTGLTNCNIDTDGSGRVVCGTDQGLVSCSLQCATDSTSSCSGLAGSGWVFSGTDGSEFRCCRTVCS